MTQTPATQPSRLRICLEAVPLAALVVVLVLWAQIGTVVNGANARRDTIGTVPLQTLRAQSATQLSRQLAQRDYQWPPRGVPALALQALPHDLDQLPVADKKRVFLQSLLPLVLAENRRVAAERQFVQQALADWPLPEGQRRARLKRLAARYQVKGDLEDEPVRRRLLRRVDQVPPALALAQAANETGWGTSRFAREANNLFGQWTYDASEGLVPKDRAEGKSHYVRRFSDLRASVRGYLRNLNTHPAYRGLRERREQLRNQRRPLDALELAAGLQAYSERGMDYVEDIRAMIRHNDLQRLAGAELRPSG